MKKTIIILLLMLCIIPGYSQSNETYSPDFKMISSEYIRTLHLIQTYYKNTTNIDSLHTGIIKKVLYNLDSKLVNRDTVNSKSGEKGLNINFFVANDGFPYIINFEKGSNPDGILLPWDKILTIDDISCRNLNYHDIKKLLTGEKPSSVLTVMRNGKILISNVKRENISSTNIQYYNYQDIGYIRVENFPYKFEEEFDNVLKILFDNGAKRFVLDLRNNQGGYLRACSKCIDKFTDNNKIMFSTQTFNQNNSYNNKEYISDSDFIDLPLVVLVNDKTASGAELVAGSLQDWDRAIIIGQKTNGVTNIHQPFYLPSGLLINLNTSEFVFPSGRQISFKEEDKDKAIGDILTDSTYCTFSLVKHRPLNNHSGIVPDYCYQEHFSETQELLTDKDKIQNFIISTRLLEHVNSIEQIDISDDILTSYLTYLGNKYSIFPQSEKENFRKQFSSGTSIQLEQIESYAFYDENEVNKIKNEIKYELISALLEFSPEKNRISHKLLDYDKRFQKSLNYFEKFDKHFIANIKIKDENNNRVIALLNILDANTGEQIKSMEIKDSVEIALPCSIAYSLNVQKPGYFAESFSIDKRLFTDQMYFDQLEFEKEVILFKYEDISRKNLKFRINNIHFGKNKYSITESSEPELYRLAKAIKENPDWAVEITGHTDSDGSDFYNELLSKKRSNAIVEYLISKGCDPQKMSSFGAGESQPVASNETEEGKQLNRRVEFKVIGSDY